MLSIFNDPWAAAVFLSAVVIGPFLTWLATRRKQQSLDQAQETANYSKIVSDAVKLKQEFQDDYNALRKRLVDLEAQLLAQRQRILALEAENQQLRYQLAIVGVNVPPAVINVPITTPLPKPAKQQPAKRPRITRPTLLKPTHPPQKGNDDAS